MILSLNGDRLREPKPRRSFFFTCKFVRRKIDIFVVLAFSLWLWDNADMKINDATPIEDVIRSILYAQSTVEILNDLELVETMTRLASYYVRLQKRATDLYGKKGVGDIKLAAHQTMMALTNARREAAERFMARVNDENQPRDDR